MLTSAPVFASRAVTGFSSAGEGRQPDPLRGAPDEHRREDRFLDALAEAGLELRVGDLLALEVLREDVVVCLRGGFEQLVASLVDLAGQLVGDRDLDLLRSVELVRLAVDEVDVAAELLALADRDLEGGDLVAERRTEGIEGVRRVGVLPVRLVDEEAGRGVRRPPEGDRLLEPGLDPARGVDRDDRAIGGVEALDDLGHEVRVAGRVDEGDPRPVPLERRDGQAQRGAALLLLRLVVEMGSPVLHPAEAGHGARPKEKLLGERRLAGAGVPGQDDASEVRQVNALHRHRLGVLSCSGCR